VTTSSVKRITVTEVLGSNSATSMKRNGAYYLWVWMWEWDKLFQKFIYQKELEGGGVCIPTTRRKRISYTKDNTKKKELITHNSCEGKGNSKRLWRMAKSESTFLSSFPRFPKGALLSDVSQVSFFLLLVRATCRWNLSQRRLFRHKSDIVWPGIELGPPRWGALITLH
jgi:hypothetical protein